MPAPCGDPAHARPVGLAAELRRAARVARHLVVGELDEVEGHFAVHHDGEFVVRGGVPRRFAFDPYGLGNIFEVLRHRDAFERRRASRHLEHVGEGVFPEVVLELDYALLVAVERTDMRVVGHILLPKA